MKIAFIGSRGIPARYSGFETFYEQLAVRLAARGHHVTVYNRSHFIRDVRGEYRGVRIVSLPSAQTKHLDTITHTLLASLHAMGQGYDIAYYCIVGNSPLVWMPRIVGTRTLLNVDGEDWAREKWGPFARWYQKRCERIATRTAGVIISDAHAVERRYRELLRTPTVFVPYGGNIARDDGTDALDKWGLRAREYILYVGRFVPENAIDVLIEAFRGLQTDRRLVIVGDAPYTGEYKQRLRELARGDERIVFTGYQFGRDYAQLSSHAYLYVQPSGVDGTRPALLDQLGFGNCVVVRNTAANMEVIGECGASFDRTDLVDSLRDTLGRLLRDSAEVEELRRRAHRRITDYYNWEWVADFHEDLFSRILDWRELLSYDEFLARRAATPSEQAPLWSGRRPNVLGVGVHPVDIPEAVRLILAVHAGGRRGYVCCTSVHGVMEAQKDTELKRIHNRSLLTVPDGMPTVWTGHGQGFFHMQRVYGPELMLRLIEATSGGGDGTGPRLSHFFYGAKPETIEQLVTNLRRQFPGLCVAGTYAPPFRPLRPEEEADIAARVAEAKPDIFWVGLSTPKQERFMAEHIQSLDVRIMLGVGAAFDIHAGRRRDAPAWMKRTGLQWVHRLWQEPRRLWRRYLTIVPSFLWCTALQSLGIRKYRMEE